MCGQCGAVQPLGPTEDYFGALGAPRSFAQDRPALEKRFYALSRSLHPDRFTLADAATRNLSLQRMSFLNQAYRTLKDPALTREYLLALEGVKSPKGTPPLEIAERWFGIQDAVMDNAPDVLELVRAFEADLALARVRTLEQIAELEASYDSRPERGTLEAVEFKIHALSYLTSLERDVVRIKLTGILR